MCKNSSWINGVLHHPCYMPGCCTVTLYILGDKHSRGDASASLFWYPALTGMGLICLCRQDSLATPAAARHFLEPSTWLTCFSYWSVTFQTAFWLVQCYCRKQLNVSLLSKYSPKKVSQTFAKLSPIQRLPGSFEEEVDALQISGVSWRCPHDNAIRLLRVSRSSFPDPNFDQN